MSAQSTAPGLHAYRAALLRFDERFPQEGRAIYDEDGLLVVQAGKIIAVGDFASLAPRYSGIPTQHFPGRILAPGFIDTHVHFPQIDIIGAPAEGLLPWLENYTFPEEKCYISPEYCAEAAHFFVAQLLQNGVSTALCFGSSHPASVDALFEAADARRMRMIAGKCLMDRHCPEGVRDQTEQSLQDTQALIERWQGKGQRGQLGYAITPRFAPSCSDAQMRGAGILAAKYPDTWIQSHVSENDAEIAWVRELYPQDRSYLAVYERFGLLRKKAVYAHCIHFDDADRAMLRDSGAAAAVCPTSNLFLGSGNFDFALAMQQGLPHALASDVGGGTSLSPFKTMLAAHYVSRSSSRSIGVEKQPNNLSAQQLWWLHTAGAARCLGLQGVVGNLAPGCDADILVLNPNATELLARRTQRASDLQELLFAMIVLGDERLVEQTILA